MVLSLTHAQRCCVLCTLTQGWWPWGLTLVCTSQDLHAPLSLGKCYCGQSQSSPLHLYRGCSQSVLHRAGAEKAATMHAAWRHSPRVSQERSARSRTGGYWDSASWLNLAHLKPQAQNPLGSPSRPLEVLTVCRNILGRERTRRPFPATLDLRVTSHVYGSSTRGRVPTAEGDVISRVRGVQIPSGRVTASDVIY